MKNYIYILFPLLLLAISCDNDELSDNQAKSFVKYYGGNLNDEGMRVVALNHGGYLLMGNIETPNRGKDICVIITDKFGNATGPAKVYGSIFNDYGHAIKKNAQGYVIAGSTEETNSGKKNILLIQISETGTEIWKTIKVLSPTNEEANDILILENQTIVLTGYIDDVITSKKDLFLAKTSSLGEFTQEISKIGYPSGDEIGYAISNSAEAGSYIFAGYTTGSNVESTTKKVWIIKWGGFSPPITLQLPNEIAWAKAIIPQEENNYVVLCNMESGLDSKIKVAKINVGKSIKVLWEKYYGENDINTVNYGFSHNNKIYMIGSSGSNDFGNILLLEIDPQGDSPAYHYVGDGLSFSGQGFDFTSDQGLIITGANKKNANSLITLIKLKSDFSL